MPKTPCKPFCVFCWIVFYFYSKPSKTFQKETKKSSSKTASSWSLFVGHLKKVNKWHLSWSWKAMEIPKSWNVRQTTSTDFRKFGRCFPNLIGEIDECPLNQIRRVKIVKDNRFLEETFGRWTQFSEYQFVLFSIILSDVDKKIKKMSGQMSGRGKGVCYFAVWEDGKLWGMKNLG